MREQAQHCIFLQTGPAQPQYKSKLITSSLHASSVFRPFVILEEQQCTAGTAASGVLRLFVILEGQWYLQSRL